MGTLTYIRNFFKDHYVASLVPTFKGAIKRVCSEIDFSRDLLIVEYGAGTGVFTRYLLSRMTSSSRLIAIERNPGMFAELSQRFSDPRLSLFNESAERVNELLGSDALRADYVISGIPFSLFPAELTEQIVTATYDILRPGGKFIVYQCLRSKKGERNSVLPILERRFNGVSKRSVPFNIPPLIIYSAGR